MKTPAYRTLGNRTRGDPTLIRPQKSPRNRAGTPRLDLTIPGLHRRTLGLRMSSRGRTGTQGLRRRGRGRGRRGRRARIVRILGHLRRDSLQVRGASTLKHRVSLCIMSLLSAQLWWHHQVGISAPLSGHLLRHLHSAPLSGHLKGLSRHVTTLVMRESSAPSFGHHVTSTYFTRADFLEGLDKIIFAFSPTIPIFGNSLPVQTNISHKGSFPFATITVPMNMPEAIIFQLLPSPPFQIPPTKQPLSMPGVSKRATCPPNLKYFRRKISSKRGFLMLLMWGISILDVAHPCRNILWMLGQDMGITFENSRKRPFRLYFGYFARNTQRICRRNPEVEISQDFRVEATFPKR